jgi:hypothetical protein
MINFCSLQLESPKMYSTRYIAISKYQFYVPICTKPYIKINLYTKFYVPPFVSYSLYKAVFPCTNIIAVR